MVEILDDADAIADRIVTALNGKVVLGLPLGLSKATRIANALYRRAQRDPAVTLDIFTALTLEPPEPKADLEKRFLGPIVQRLFGGYERLAYAQALRAGTLPNNVTVSEFFLLAGRWLGSGEMQQHYISANYTHAARMLRDKGVNCIAQLVAKAPGGDAYSLSCNTDITLDLLPMLEAAGRTIVLAGETSAQLPFMGEEAALPKARFDFVLETPQEDEPSLFVLPKQPVSEADHAIGIHAASLVKDGGTIQIGIGSLGDALVAALILRHTEPDLFARTLAALCHGSIPEGRQTTSFRTGLYAASEMFVDGFMELRRSGILKREAHDGALVHAGFLLGSGSFYDWLRLMTPAERDRFRMRGISFVNELHGDEARKRADRVDARFVNSAMMATLLGDTVSDGLENGAVVSGVGGQYNFVAQAFALEGARSIITLNASRTSKGRRSSRILWSYGHTTIPRHLRDVFITEYGVAELRGLNDRDCILAMSNIAEAAFQDGLLSAARKSGKIQDEDVTVRRERRNTPEYVSNALREAQAVGLCQEFPFGSEFTAVEKKLLQALNLLKERAETWHGRILVIAQALLSRRTGANHAAELDRMGLSRATSAREFVAQRLVA